MIRAIIFDYDDTLVLTFRNYMARDREVCRFFKIPEPSEFAYRQAWGLVWQEMVHRLHPDVRPEEFMAQYAKMHSSVTVQPIEGMQELLRALHKDGLFLGIVSSKPSQSLLMRTISLDIKKHLFFCHGAEDTHYHKPDPRAFTEALELLKPHIASPSQVLYVGDLLLDAMASRGAGMSFCAVLTGPTQKKEFLDAGIPEGNILQSILDLPAWLKSQ